MSMRPGHGEKKMKGTCKNWTQKKKGNATVIQTLSRVPDLGMPKEARIRGRAALGLGIQKKRGLPSTYVEGGGLPYRRI